MYYTWKQQQLKTPNKTIFSATYSIAIGPRFEGTNDFSPQLSKSVKIKGKVSRDQKSNPLEWV